MPGVPIASAPCNPSIGGVGKGQVVREISALGGLMGKLADLSGIQWRILNESKGYAVQSTRVQIDKEFYPKAAEEELLSRKNISLIREKVEWIGGDKCFEVKTAHHILTAEKIVITAGTFLGGKLHVGPHQSAGGRPGQEASKGLSDLLGGRPLRTRRFKTGTPPRLVKRSIDFSRLKRQESEPKVQTFHFAHRVSARFRPQVPCYLTWTNKKAMEIIEQNKHRSPMYNGQITAVGARYCPSIEDKVHRFPDRAAHHIFLEPESLQSDLIYPAGISTCLPKAVQLSFVRAISGLESAEIALYGHGVEYDVIDTTELDKTLGHRSREGLYFAGQVNGTSGYEEAAAQGLIAGVNAALSLLGRRPLILSREDSYIGVMIEDLVCSERDEPYRLFTARCENRLLVREDNAFVRMAPYRASLGLSDELDRYLKDFETSCRELKHYIEGRRFGERDSALFEEKGYGRPRPGMSLKDLLKRSCLDPMVALRELAPDAVNERAVITTAISAKYEGHIKRALEETEKIAGLSRRPVDWQKISTSPHVAQECRERVGRIRPATFSELKNINGIRPATLAFVAGGLV